MVRVVVVGGGVAGLSAALAASRHGAKTTLLESSKKVGVSRALMPFLIYSLYVVWQHKGGVEKRMLVWLAGAAFLWILVSSARGGGDQWDNPRYRTILLVVLSLLTGLGWNWSREHRDAWLGRWLLVEGIFLFFFTGWYLKRYTPVGFKLPFWVMIAVIVGLSAGVLVGGWAWDGYRARKRNLKPSLTHPPESV